jgi:hypothetical protein
MEKLNFLDYYRQTKQRIDIDVDIDRKGIMGKTKLTYVHGFSKDTSEFEGKRFYIRLNAENMFIKSIAAYQPSSAMSDIGESIADNLKPLSYRYLHPSDVQSYLKDLYQPIEDVESFKNVNRIEWEQRSLGNLEIDIDSSYLIDSTSGNVNPKFKIIIEYQVEETYIGAIFQSYYDEKIDLEHTICYTPNFYFNTAYWVPCHYDLKSHIIWNIYVIIQNDYSVYCSTQLVCIYQDKDKRAFHYKTKEPLSAKNIGFIALNDKVFTRVEDTAIKSVYYIVNEGKKERVEKNLIQNGLINAVYSFYEEFFESDVTTPNSTFVIFIPYLAINSSFTFDRSAKSENFFNFLKFPNLYILPEKLIYNDTIPDIVEFQLKNLGKLFICNYIGGLINEYNYCDFWLICGLENWLSDCFLQKCFGNNFVKDRLFNYIRKFRKICLSGKEKRPLFTNLYNHPV